MAAAFFVTWPYFCASAAGVRSWSVLHAMRAAFGRVHVASAAAEREATVSLRAAGLTATRLPTQDFSAHPTLASPRAALFDRFYVEEMYSWRVDRAALRVLDTQDLHHVRAYRQRLVEEHEASSADAMRENCPVDDDTLCRELAACHRSDVVLAVSAAEALRLLALGIPFHKVVLAPFFYPPRSPAETPWTASMAGEPAARAPAPRPAFADRSGYVYIGNFRHPPNLDGLRLLLGHVWPAIRARHAAHRPDAPLPELDVHGAYAGTIPRRLAAEYGAEGVRFRGFAPCQFRALAARRVQLAPLRFGAGIKGKVADGWHAGTPCITTPVGAEGMDGQEVQARRDLARRVAAAAAATAGDTNGGEAHQKAGEADGTGDGGLWPFGGDVVDAVDVDGAADAAFALHEDPGRWNAAQAAGDRLLARLFDARAHEPQLAAALRAASLHAPAHRGRDATQAVLWHASLRYTEIHGRLVERRVRDP